MNYPKESKRVLRRSKSERLSATSSSRNNRSRGKGTLERSNSIRKNNIDGKKKQHFDLRRLMCSSAEEDDRRFDTDENDDWEAQHRSCWASFQQTFKDEQVFNKSSSSVKINNNNKRDQTSHHGSTFKGLTVRLLCRSRAVQDDNEEDEQDFPMMLGGSQAETHYTHSSSSTEDLDSSRTTDDSEHQQHVQLQEDQQEVIVTPVVPIIHNKGLRFADEVGQDIETIHYTECEYSEPHSMRRIMILLLSPQDRRFELIQVSYHTTKERMTVKDVTKQLHKFAADAVLQNQSYTGLACRRLHRNTGGVRTEELLRTLCIQDYDLVKNEILVALVDGYSSTELMSMAEVLLENKNVRKAARLAKKSRRAIQPLHPSTSRRRRSTSSSNYKKTIYPRASGVPTPMSQHRSEIACEM